MLNIRTGLKKFISYFITILLIVTTFLCIILVFESVSSGNVNLFGYRIFYVVTGSMEPTIPAGSVVITRSSPASEYSVGDVITFRSKISEIFGQPNTHRIVEIQNTDDEVQYITRGDANNANDSIPVKSSEIYGKVVWNSNKMQWFGTVFTFLTTPFGFLFVILLPILAITISQLKDFIKTYKEALYLVSVQKISANSEQHLDPEVDKLNDDEVEGEKNEQQ